MNPSPFLVVPAMLWTAVAALAVLAVLVLFVRSVRREPEPASDAWDPFGTGFPVIALAAVAAFTVAAAVQGHFSLGDTGLGILWPVMAATALVHAAGRRGRSWPRWSGAAFAAVGAALYGSLPL
ncbi:hypothetical protein OG252_38130 [Streptomyces sp. NBC_01352]|uniref:hypothetical protein n=1 Tax=unclassified Streptomyces TaxID=2593676 RepID=UPI0022533E3A|nr:MULTISPECIES: hypothetical protein [unclassified Streptomyces]MCX4701764.1 hypothetical protein [Streptomyces sp. NBC_01373]